jgi:hypothetical protein
MLGIKRSTRIRKGVHPLKDVIGSSISSTLRLWNCINAEISRVDSGESYLTPCLMVKDLSSLRAIASVRESDRGGPISCTNLARPLALSERPDHHEAVSIRRRATEDERGAILALYRRRMPSRTYTCIFSSSS